MKTFNNISGTTSSEFNIGVGAMAARNIVLGAVCNGVNAFALDRNGYGFDVEGTEFYNLKMFAKDQDGRVAAKHIRGTITVGGNITRIEDIFEETFDGDIILSLNVNTLNIECNIGTAISATYNIYITLQHIS